MIDETLYSPRVTVGLLDENNTIINSFYMFANVALLPGQCITLYGKQDKEKKVEKESQIPELWENNLMTDVQAKKGLAEVSGK